MQPRGNFQACWIMFDHVKCVDGWMTLVCHVYNLIYCKVMTIAVCDLRSKNIDAQCLMWQKLNKVMAKNGVAHPNFKGFMANILT